MTIKYSTSTKGMYYYIPITLSNDKRTTREYMCITNTCFKSTFFRMRLKEILMKPLFTGLSFRAHSSLFKATGVH